MFDKMKQIYELQKKAKLIKKELEQIVVNVDESGGKIKIVINGELKIQSVFVDPYFLVPEKKAELENTLKRAISNAIGQAQQKSAGKMQEMARDLGLPNIPGLM